MNEIVPGDTIPEMNDDKISYRIAKWLLPIFIFISAFLLQSKIIPLGLDLHHDLFMFDAAKKVSLGELPYKDFFYQYNIATVWFHLLALKVFGVKILSLKLATGIVYAFIAFLIYECSRQYSSIWKSGFIALLWSLLSPFFMPEVNGYHAWSTVYMMVAVMLGLYFLIKAHLGNALIWSFLCGTSFNLAFWFKQIAAIQILAIIILLLLLIFRFVNNDESKLRYKNIFYGFALGGIISSLPFFFYLFNNSLLVDWWKSALVFNGLFAATGESTSGLYLFVKTVFPVSRDLGYLTIVWAVMPIFLLFIIRILRTEISQTAFGNYAVQKNGLVFVLAISLAGWIEYFPLAHSFHTQLFMAPAFVLFSINYSKYLPKLDTTNFRINIILSVTVLSLLIVLFEGYKHMSGLKTKLSSNFTYIPGDVPVSGLYLPQSVYNNFEQFYSTLLQLKEEAGDNPFIPRSVDPIRALLPEKYIEKPVFKIGADWTWPNEIVEPGFNNSINLRIAERQSPIYSDSLIYIPGYVPTSILEMVSPLTFVHTLYRPTSNKQITEPELKVIDNVGAGLSDYFNAAEKYSMSGKTGTHSFNFVPINIGKSKTINEISNINVTVVKKSEIPVKLSAYQYEYFLEMINSPSAKEVQSLFYKKNDSTYVLKYPLQLEESLNIFKFFITRGKLFKRHNLPTYFSTLLSEPHRQPFIISFIHQEDDDIKRLDDVSAELVWSKFHYDSHSKVIDRNRLDNYLAFPAGVVLEDEATLIFAQVVYSDNSTEEFYFFYSPTKH
jgi:hypothetical protein